MGCDPLLEKVGVVGALPAFLPPAYRNNITSSPTYLFAPEGQKTPYAGTLKHIVARKSGRRGERRAHYHIENPLPGYATH